MKPNGIFEQWGLAPLRLHTLRLLRPKWFSDGAFACAGPRFHGFHGRLEFHHGRRNFGGVPVEPIHAVFRGEENLETPAAASTADTGMATCVGEAAFLVADVDSKVGGGGRFAHQPNFHGRQCMLSALLFMAELQRAAS